MSVVLIVDDSMLARLVIKQTLPGNEGHEIHEASNGREAINKFKDLRPDVMFLDLTMPDMDGEAVLRRLGTIKHNTRIFVVSADVQKKTAEKVLSLGAEEILKKPPAKESILSIMHTFGQ
ncbi:MAG: response regulator [Desulfobacteraceae bacterium]|nr:response regulator [Desulfobacteraceae bacterium]